MKICFLFLDKGCKIKYYKLQCRNLALPLRLLWQRRKAGHYGSNRFNSAGDVEKRADGRL